MSMIRSLFHTHPEPTHHLHDALMYPVHKPMRTGGIVMMILVGVGLYWMLPEIRRYLRIERM